MGALSVAWTVRSSAELSQSLPYFDRYIFEAFVPGELPAPNMQLLADTRIIRAGRGG